MDYLDLVLKGYFDENNNKFLEKYFLREYKKAEKEKFFEPDEFFTGCINVVKGWEKNLEFQVIERQRDLFRIIEAAESNKLSYNDLMGKTIEQRRKETIEYCGNELENIRPDGIGSLTFTVHLLSLTNGRIAYNMTYNEVLRIKHSILIAYQETQNNIQPLPPQQTETKTELEKPRIPAKFYALYHWLKIEMGTENQFTKNDNGQFIKTEIEAYCKEKYPNCSKQGFYRSFKDLDITNRAAIANSFGNGYKEILITISNNDNKLITHLKNYPN